MSDERTPEPADVPSSGGAGAPEPGAQPVGWAWAQQSRPVAPPTAWVETEPLAYHQLLRGVPRYRWWRPLLALALGLLYYVTLSIVFSALVIVPYLLITGAEFSEAEILALALPDTQRPVSLIVSLGSVALMIPSVWLAMLSTGLTPVTRSWSVALRIRWGLLGRTLLPAVVALLVMNAVGIAAGAALAGPEVAASSGPAAEVAGSSSSGLPFDPTLALWSTLIILLLVPFQAAAEEVVFRGFFMQALGAWLHTSRGGRFGVVLRGPMLPVLIPSLLFGFAHIYDLWGWLTVVLLALVAGWLTWRTGGLEAAITIHVINNLVAFGFLVLAVGGETAQTASGAGVGSVVGAIAGLGVYVWWVDRLFARRGGPRTRIDLVQPLAGGERR